VKNTYTPQGGTGKSPDLFSRLSGLVFMGVAGGSEYSVRIAKFAIIALINKISKHENWAFLSGDRVF
jgi:hypothetical protein